MKNLAYLTFILCFLAPTAQAQQHEYNSGIKYTTMRPKPAQDNAQTKQIYNHTKPNTTTETARPKGAPAQKAPQIATEADSALPKAPSDTASPQKSSEQSVWDKYRELAEGRKDSKSDTSNKPSKPEKPSAPQQAKMKAKQEKPSTGLGSIIADYQRNKENRGRMQSMRFSKPQKPSADKPETEKPSVEKPPRAIKNRTENE